MQTSYVNNLAKLIHFKWQEYYINVKEGFRNKVRKLICLE